MFKYLVYSSLLISFSSSLSSEDIRNISFLERPNQHEENTLGAIQRLIETKKHKRKNADYLTPLLKSYLNQVNLLLNTHGKSCLTQFSKQLTNFINSSSDSYSIYSDWMFALCRALKKIEYIPNPPSNLLEKKNELIELCALLNNHVAEKHINRFYDQINYEKFSSITLGNISLGSDLLLKKYLEFKVMTLDKNERIYHYNEWVPQLTGKEINKLFDFLDSNEKETLIEEIFASCDSSETMLNHFKALKNKLSADNFSNLAKKAYEKNRTSLLCLIEELSPFKTEAEKFSGSIPVLPGRYGSNNIFRATIGDSDLIFYMNSDKFITSLRTVGNINSKTIIGVDTIAKNLSQPYYKTAHEKYPAPLGYTQQHNPVYYDPYGYDAELNLHNENIKNFKKSLKASPKSTKSRIDMCMNHAGMQWYSFNELNQQITSEAEQKYDFYKSHRFIEYTLSDWQLSPGVLSGLLVNDPKTEDRYIIPIFSRDRLTVCFLEKKIPNNIDANRFIPKHIQIGAMDYQSDISPGSTKGKSINNLFWGYLNNDEVNSIKKHAIVLNSDKTILDNNSRLYSNGLELKKIPFNTEIQDVKFIYQDSIQGIEIFNIQSKKTAKFASKLQTLFGIKGQFAKAFKLVKQSPGLSHFGEMNFPISKDTIVLCLNKSHLPEGYVHLPISKDCLKQNLPWIHLINMPNDFCLKMNFKAFIELSLTPIEEILFRNTSNNNNNNHISCSRDMEKFETEIELYFFENDL